MASSVGAIRGGSALSPTFRVRGYVSSFVRHGDPLVGRQATFRLDRFEQCVFVYVDFRFNRVKRFIRQRLVRVPSTSGFLANCLGQTGGSLNVVCSLTAVVGTSRVFGRGLRDDVGQRLCLRKMNLNVPVRRSCLFAVRVGGNVIARPQGFGYSTGQLVRVADVRCVSVPLVRLFGDRKDVEQRKFLFFYGDGRVHGFVRLGEECFSGEVEDQDFEGYVFGVFLSRVTGQVVL